MKIGIYSICKNEQANFDNWYEQVKGADHVFVLDTGSTDKTLDLLQEKWDESRIADNKHFSYNYYGRQPFSFDSARNMALSGLLWNSSDIDYAVWVDFDETFPENWVESLRASLILCRDSQAGLPHSMQFTNRFDGHQSIWYQTRGHIPKLYQWKYGAHEVLMPLGELPNEVIGSCDIQIVHPDKEVRNDYTELLLKSHQIHCDGRSSYYLGREYYYNSDYDQASKYLRECLFVHNGWQAERGEAAKMLSIIHGDDKINAVKYLHFYLAYCNLQREPYLELARYYYEHEEWESVKHYALQALEISEPPASYLTMVESNYTHVPHDLLMMSYDRLGDNEQAAYHAALCLQYNPTEPRFIENVQYFLRIGVLKLENHPTEASD